MDVELEEPIEYTPADGVGWEKGRRSWKRELISLLKDSPSTERKFLRWKIAKSYPHTSARGRAYTIVVKEGLEVLPETPL